MSCLLISGDYRLNIWDTLKPRAQMLAKKSRAQINTDKIASQDSSYQRTEALDEKTLISLSIEGDKEHYRVLVERYSSRIRAAIFDVLKDYQEAEDLTQETFVKAFFSLKNFKGDSSFYSWVFRIAYNLSIDQRRKQARRGGEHLEYDEELDQSSSTGENPALLLERKQISLQVNSALAGLSEEHRAVVVLREVDGLNYDEIAEALEIPRGTVMSRLFYARKVLQRVLSKFYGERDLEVRETEQTEVLKVNE